MVISTTFRNRARPRMSLTATANDLWQRATSLNHRFDKRGNPMPMELHGCGCGLCARQQRELHQYWEAR